MAKIKLSKKEIAKRTARLMAWEDKQRATWFLIGAGVYLGVQIVILILIK